MTLIYKILSKAEWRAAPAAGVFRGSAVDLNDGYIHFSSAAQAPETAAKHFSGRHDLMLFAVEAENLGSQLHWETSRGGERFPHLYAELPLSAVVWVRPLPLGADGRYDFGILAP